MPNSPPLLSSTLTPAYSGTPTRVVPRSRLPPLSPAPPPPDARRPRPSCRRRQLPLTPSGHNSAPAFLLLRSCAPLLTLLLRHADTHAPACPLDLAPLALYVLHSVRLPPSPAVSIMIMISIPHRALLTPHASRSLVLLRLEDASVPSDPSLFRIHGLSLLCSSVPA
ncbi:hypothetical protein B0H13DRAFT_2358156 [Mycena leptocephala]|nr:hypothetical protein B0H13DRAFT_2358156 [Mycena leptocephala]